MYAITKNKNELTIKVLPVNNFGSKIIDKPQFFRIIYCRVGLSSAISVCQILFN